MKRIPEVAIQQITENFFLGQYSETQMQQLLDTLGKVSVDSGGAPNSTAAQAAPGSRPAGQSAETLDRAVAIVGMGGFFPGSASIEEFRRHLQEQHCLIGQVPANHYCAAALAQRRGSFIADIAGFDHELFGIAAREAQYMDPRLRLLLMSAWHTFEDAGIVPTDLNGAVVDVLVASEESAYGEFIARGEMLPYTPIGASSWSLPNRISHAFGLTGKSLFINTACAGGSVALHQALRTLRSGEADYVLVGAANLLYGEAAMLTYLGQEALGILADADICRPFQQEAKGFVPAEAVVTVLLRRHADAVRDGNHIHGVLLGSHVNHVGGRGSPTAPDAKAQAAAIIGAYADARVAPATVTYIEAHGACTLLGDLEEINAFTEVEKHFAATVGDVAAAKCQISSVKPNMGHANSASGLVSLVRVLHAFKTAQRFGIKDFNGGSGLLNLANSRYRLEAQHQSWERLSSPDGVPLPRRAAINNFSAGGVNAHLIVQEPAPVEPAESPRSAVYFLALSALHEEQLVTLARSMLEMIEARTCGNCEQLEISSVLSRRALRCRVVFRYQDLDDLCRKLRKYVDSKGRSGYLLKSDAAGRTKVASYFRTNAKLAQSLAALREDSDKRLLFELWNDGYEEPVQRYLRDRKSGRCALPTYPFRRETVWMQPAAQPPLLGGHAPAVLHALVHENVSTLDGVLFRSTFSGREAHFVDAGDGRRSLPRDVLLEMAQVAIRLSLGNAGSATAEAAAKLDEVEWGVPFVIDTHHQTGTQLRIAIGNDASGAFAFEIFSQDESVYCSGTVVVDTAAVSASSQSSAASSRAKAVPNDAMSRRGASAGLSIAESLQWDLQTLAAEVLNAPRQKLHGDTNLAEFGFDSVGLGLLAKRLSGHFGLAIAPTVFFGRSTLLRLAEYFLDEHPAAMEAFYTGNIAANVQTAVVTQPVQNMRKSRRLTAARLDARRNSGDLQEPIAIIGMSGRFPQADDIDGFWTVLAEGRDAVGSLAARAADWNDASLAARRCGVIDGIAEFDALFFEISPREAEAMDPRQRLLLQESMKALEDAGYGAQQLRRSSVGVFVGVEPGQYQDLTGKQDSVTDNSDCVLAARISYFLDLTGPNMAINTACSSGLVAAHQACMSLRQRECDTAIAAAVNLLVSPEPFIGMDHSGMLSPDGRCYAFDRRANGMVPGEAVVSLVLKRLADAQAEGDPIHAVIRASGVNYDGRTNGITAPSGVAQARLLQSVYKKYSIPVDDIEYIVAHGTGTQLGDPIEIDALRQAFKDDTQRRQYCALTSAKTNFGHTFAASGLVSLVCVVQAMRHEQIPPSLHCEHSSEHVNWADSPFFVNTALKPWPRRPGKARLGAVSAFGVSGTNAHFVVESHETEDQVAADAPHYLLVLSAKQPQALKRRVDDLSVFLQSPKSADLQLDAISHTCLAGRLHYRHRCAVVAWDRESAIAALQQWSENDGPATVFRGQVERSFTAPESLAEHGRDLIRRSTTQRGDPGAYRETLKALAQLYCQGYELDWQELFGPRPPRRVHLPTYPFARERHWLRGTAPQRAATAGPMQLHPLLHANTSDFGGQRFTARCSGEEFFFADHVIDGRRVLPGVAYLEMARAAVEHSLEGRDDAGRMVLRNVVWLRPIVADSAPLEIHISLQPQEDGQIAFEIYTYAAENEPLIHCQGMASLSATDVVHSLRLSDLQAACVQSTSVAECYEQFARMGMQYGPAQRGLEALYVGGGQVLAKLRLPETLAEAAQSYVVHPSLLDSALQAAIGLPTPGASAQPLMPFSLESAEIFSACPAQAWAWLRPNASHGTSDKVRRLDIDVCDEQGRVCVRLHAFAARALGSAPVVTENPAISTLISTAAAAERRDDNVLLLKPQWHASPSPMVRDSKSQYVQHHIMLCGWDPNVADSVAAELGAHCQALRGEGGVGERFIGYSTHLLAKLQQLIAARPSAPVLVQVVVPAPAGGLRGLAGLLKTARLENPHIAGQLLEIAEQNDLPLLLARLRGDADTTVDEVRYA